MSRIFPLLDEIRMHVLTWASDDDFKKLNPALNQSLTMVLNEIKIHDALAKMGTGDERENDNNPKAERTRFVAIFKQKYLEYCDFNYSETITPTAMFSLGKVVERLLSEGTSSLEFLNWFFDEWAREERNKKWMPPTLMTVCMSWIVDKFIFQNKDKFRIRKSDLVDIGLKNCAMNLAVSYMEVLRQKGSLLGRDFGQKVISFSRGEISVKKFIGLFKSFAEKEKDVEVIQKLNDLLPEK